MESCVRHIHDLTLCARTSAMEPWVEHWRLQAAAAAAAAAAADAVTWPLLNRVIMLDVIVAAAALYPLVRARGVM